VGNGNAVAHEYDGGRAALCPPYSLSLADCHAREGGHPVIPAAKTCVTSAKAGVQLFVARVPRELDTGFRRYDE
jgi:hypothetical protein